MLVHGVDDPIVPVFQSRRMKEALERAGKSVDYIEIRDAGHADWEQGVPTPFLPGATRWTLQLKPSAR
jgi:pimeloyl-ACP methyl ester carboxylesterase